MQKSETRTTVGFSLDKQLVHKLQVIYTVDKYFFGNKTTLSGIIDKALTEYFDNHAEEIQKMMDEYHEKGGCFLL